MVITPMEMRRRLSPGWGCTSPPGNKTGPKDFDPDKRTRRVSRQLIGWATREDPLRPHHECLQQTALSHRQNAVAGDDEVVQNPGVNQSQCRTQRLRECLVGPAGLGNSGRMVMRQYHSSSAMSQCSLDDFARVHAGLGHKVPRNISSAAMTRFCASRNSTMKTSSRLARVTRR